MTAFFELQGKIAFVTGASSGLGASFARTLAAAGCIVGIAGRRQDKLEAVAAQISDAGGTALPLALDVTDTNAMLAGLEYLSAVHGTPSIIVNNAGIAIPQGFVNAKPDDTSRTIAVNQTALWNVAQCSAAAMMKAGVSGSIINIASIAGIAQLGGAAAYGMTKAAVVQMTKLQAQELARHNIRVNAIAPGYFETAMNESFLKSQRGQELIARIPMQRTGIPEELDGILLLLASDRSSFMTGSVVPVDGGHLVGSL